jgi:hypothetical protein
MLTFRKLILLALFIVTAYALHLWSANGPLNAVLYGLALLAAATWLARELTGVYLATPRPPFSAPQRDLSRADYQHWLNGEAARRDRYNHHLTLMGIGIAALLVIVAMGFVAWQAVRPLVPAGVAPLVVLAIAALMVFYASGLKRLRPGVRIFNLG